MSGVGPPSTAWDDLVACALLGTARRPPALPVAPNGSALAGVLAELPLDDPEGTVLAAGAVLGLYRQAGRRAAVDAGPPLPECPVDRRPTVSEVAASRLPSMVDGPFRPVLAEWLALVVGAGRLVPADRLPGLLDVGSAHPGLRPAVAAVAGERGRWLGGLNPAWAWAAGAEDDASTWATGASPARRLLLRRLRATDPAGARHLLESTWATETPDDRAAFVATLAAGLTMEDEAFLEAALDDRRKEVRTAAAELLWRLPASAMGARMAERARPLVAAGALPTEVDPPMARDGIVARPPSGWGQRAWWLHQLVAATPLATWGAPPALIERADPVVLDALATAAVRQRDEAWALALLDAGYAGEPALVAVVPADRAVAVIRERIAGAGLTPTTVELLLQCPPPWSRELSVDVVGHLTATVQRRGATKLDDIALRLDPSVAPAATDALADHAPWWSDVVGWFLDLLTFRAAMREEIF